jgi:hypothetical protein
MSSPNGRPAISASMVRFGRQILQNTRGSGSFRQAHNRQNNSEIKWLPFLDIYRTMCIAPSPDFLRALEGISALRVAA